jgi:hypothetical protein
MTLSYSYIPLFTITYFFWWYKPKDIRTPSVVTLPAMSPEQKYIFTSMAVSNKFDNEGMKDKVALWNLWYLTPRVFEKEAEDKAMRALQQAGNKAAHTAIERATKNTQANPGAMHESIIGKREYPQIEHQPIRLPKEIVLSDWDPDLYKSKIWPAACLFGASFGALHLISWNNIFPTTVELWLWRTSAFVSILSMIIFMHFKKVVFRWGGPLTIISLISPGFYFASRVVMMGQVFAALRAEDPGIYDTYDVSSYWVHLF